MNWQQRVCARQCQSAIPHSQGSVLVECMSTWLQWNCDCIWVVCLQELLGMLKRRRYPEMFAKELHKKRLVHSQLGMRFHVRDLVGLGTLAQSQTTSGLLLRVVKKF